MYHLVVPCFCSDVDECTASSPVCDVNAQCTNTRGSYTCTCKLGFSGDGKTCKGLCLWETRKKTIKCQAPRENTASLFIQHRSAFVDLSHNPMKKGPNSTPERVN